MKPDEQFTILQSVTSDSVGEVFQTVKKDGQGLAALKKIAPSLPTSAQAAVAYEDAVRKIHAAGPARTPRPIAMHLADEDSWIATEWVGAETLADFAGRLDSFESGVAAGIGCGLLDALHELHEAGVVHGGVTPHKVWLSQGFLPGGVIVGHPAQYLLRERAAEEISAQDALYLSPEQVRGEAPDVRSDLYAVGVLLYGLVTGTPLFSGRVEEVLSAHTDTPAPSASEHPNVSQDIADVIAIALHKNPEERFQTALAMRRALAHCRQGGDETSEQASAPLGMQRGQNIGELTVSNVLAQRAEEEAAAEKAAAEKAAAEQEAAEKAAAEIAAAQAVAEERAQAELEEAKEAAKEEIAEAEEAAVEVQEEAVAAVPATSEDASEQWFALSRDAEAFQRLHGEEEPPPLHEINRRYRRKSYVMIAAIVLGMLGLFLAIHFLTPSQTDQDAAESSNAPAIEDVAPEEAT